MALSLPHSFIFLNPSVLCGFLCPLNPFYSSAPSRLSWFTVLSPGPQAFQKETACLPASYLCPQANLLPPAGPGHSLLYSWSSCSQLLIQDLSILPRAAVAPGRFHSDLKDPRSPAPPPRGYIQGLVITKGRFYSEILNVLTSGHSL